MHRNYHVSFIFYCVLHIFQWSEFDEMFWLRPGTVINGTAGMLRVAAISL